MRVLLLGASGMIGQGVLRECLAAPDVTEVVSIVRAPLPEAPKHTQLVRSDLTSLVDLEPTLTGLDACFYCLGVASGGMSEADYRRVTYDYALAVAQSLFRASPKATFCFVSGASTDATSSTMWARVKGETENALKAVGFPHVFLFRPGYIQPMDGIVSKTTSYRMMYAVMSPLYPVWKRLMPKLVTSTREIGRAMLHVTRSGWADQVLDSPAINAAAAAGGAT